MLSGFKRATWVLGVKGGALGVLLSVSATAAAAPWAETGDLRARHHLEALSALGCFDGLTTTWPVNWSAVAEGLRGASDTCRTSEHAAYLRAALDRAKTETRTATVTGFRYYGRSLATRKAENGLKLNPMVPKYCKQMQNKISYCRVTAGTRPAGWPSHLGAGETVDTFAGGREQVTAMAQWRRTFDW